MTSHRRPTRRQAQRPPPRRAQRRVQSRALSRAQSRAQPRPGSGQHRVQPRYGRIGAVALCLSVTAVALLGGLGLLPTGNGPTSAYAGAMRSWSVGDELRGATTPGVLRSGTSTHPATSGEPAAPATTTASAKNKSSTSSKSSRSQALPAASGAGKRVVFDMSDQRVWLVDPAGSVTSTYLVSGSVTDNLKPGTYKVYSRSRWAVGVDDSGVMQYFVRFAHGKNAAIGFHDIPTHNGKVLQTRAQLGTPQSHGCIRQARPDAIKLWEFAPTGTGVVVVA